MKNTGWIAPLFALFLVLFAGTVSCGETGAETQITSITTTTAPAVTATATNNTGTTTGTGTPMPVDNVEVLIENYEYIPDTVTVTPGTTVTWTNNDTVGHTVTDRNSAFDSGLFGKGQTFSYTFSQPGTYEYYCIPHPFMVGKVIVR